MPSLSNKVLDFLDISLGAPVAARVGATFFEALQPFGVNAIFARAYGAPCDAGPTEHVLARVSPPGWESLYAERRFQDCNYLTRELPRRASPFRWSDIKLLNNNEHLLSRALKDCGFPDGLATPCHGPMGYVGVVSLAFERLEAVSPVDREAIEFASVILHSRMRDLKFSDRPKQVRHPLSPRERDCLGFVAAGKTDSQIADLLTVANTTVLTHVENAKRKLGARTRAQAIAICITRGIL